MSYPGGYDTPNRPDSVRSMFGSQDGPRPVEQAVLAGLKAASEPTTRAPSAEWKGTRFQQDLTGWAAATEVQVLGSTAQFLEGGCP